MNIMTEPFVYTDGAGIAHSYIDGGWSPPLSHGDRMGDMLRNQKAARGLTESVIMQHGSVNQTRLSDLATQQPLMAEKVVNGAKASGYTPRSNDIVMPGMMDYPGDPAGFFTNDEGRGKIKDTLISRNRTGDGLVEHTREPIEGEHRPKHKLPPRLLRRKYREALAANPDLKHASKAKKTEVIASLKEKHGKKRGVN